MEIYIMVLAIPRSSDNTMLSSVFLSLLICVSMGDSRETRLLHRLRTSTCPLGFTGYKSSCYMFSHITADYEKAESFCQYFDSRLAEINSRDEENFIRGYLKRKGQGFSYYISGTDLRVEGIWTWENPVRRISYLNWPPEQPSNLGGEEHCLALRDYYGYRMNDEPCQTRNRFVCEYSL